MLTGGRQFSSPVWVPSWRHHGENYRFLSRVHVGGTTGSIAGACRAKGQKPSFGFPGSGGLRIDVEARQAWPETRAREQGGREECSVLGTNLRTTPIMAAFANGMSGHADETDDSNSQLHPGCAMVPAALALAESQNREGDALLRAVILGYDIGFRFHQAFEPRSTTFGATFGSATAAGTLAALDAMQMRYLISYAAQQASGSRAWVGDDDHIEKAFDLCGHARAQRCHGGAFD